MSKFALYYGVNRKTEKLETIALEGRGELASLKARLKEDMTKQDVCDKYSCLVIASDYGLEKRFKTTLKAIEAPKKKAATKVKKKKLED